MTPDKQTYSDVQALESQVRNYRDWLHQTEEELKSLRAVLQPELDRSLHTDFSHYQEIQQHFTAMEEAFTTVSQTAREQKKLVLRLQRNPRLKLSSRIPGEEGSYLEIFTANHMKIREMRKDYAKQREALADVFKKRNMKLVFLRDQVAAWQPQITALLERRQTLTPRLDRFTARLARELAQAPSKQRVEFLASQASEVEQRTNGLNKYEEFFRNIESIARQELEGVVYLGRIGDPPKQYERKMEERLERYREILAQLDRLLPE
jgi:uncharacterized protein YukE